MSGETWGDGEFWSDGKPWDGPGVEPPPPPPMAVTSYSELKTAVAAWLKRSDLSSQIEDFIRLHEADMNRRLRVLQGEIYLEMSISTPSTALPEGWRGWRSVVLDISPPRPLPYVSVQDFHETFGARTGAPTNFTIEGDKLWWGPAPDTTYTVKVIYYRSWTPLSASAPENAMLDRHPDLYLYGALCQAEAYLQNDERLAVWLSRRDSIYATILAEDRRDRVTGSALRQSGAAYRENV